MYTAPARTWVFSSSAYSNSAYIRTTPNTAIVPAMEATTDNLEIWYTDDGDGVTDAAATWVRLVDEDEEAITLPATQAQRVQFTIPPIINLGRTRLKAVDSGGSIVSQVAQEVIPQTLVI